MNYKREMRNAKREIADAVRAAKSIADHVGGDIGGDSSRLFRIPHSAFRMQK